MKKLLAYPYLFSLTVSFLIVGGIWKSGYINSENNSTQSPAAEFLSESFPQLETIDPHESTPPAEEQGETSINTMETESEIETPQFFTADRSYFDDALFIGDSRTVGLHEYGDLGNAIVLADSGMNVYKIFKQSFPLNSVEKMTLEEILSQKNFGKIYIMLGINELGYSFEQTVNAYKNMVTTIRTLQPDALIFLQANLHITEKKSNSSPIYNNDNINRFNSEIKRMTNARNYFYLDANELFDDENGNLSVEYTVDESHVLGKYYADWVDWILQHAVTQTNEL